MMNDTLNMIIAFLGGAMLGALFFGGLWLTVRKAVTAKQPALLIFGSFLIRVGIVLVGFYFIGAGSWQKLLIVLLGFIIARFVVIHFTRSTDARQASVKREAIHET